MNSAGFIESKGLVALFEAADFILKNSPVSILGIQDLRNGLFTLAVSGETEYVVSAVEGAVAAGRKVGEVYASSVIENPGKDLYGLLKQFFPHLDSSTKKTIDEEILSSPAKGSTSEKSAVKKTYAPAEKKSPAVKNPKTEKPHPENKHAVKRISAAAGLSDTIERLRKEALGIDKKAAGTSEKRTVIKDKILLEAGKDKLQIDFNEIEKMNVHRLRHYARGFPNFPIKGREVSRANREELVELFKRIH